MTHNLYIRFECVQEDRWSKQFGPYNYVQMTYEDLRVADDIDQDANLVLAQCINGDWFTIDGTRWSDVIISPLKDITP